MPGTGQIPRGTRSLNVLALLALVAIAVGLFGMPRYGFGKLTAELNRLERRQVTVENRLATLDLLSADDDEASGRLRERRAAVLRSLDRVPELLDGLAERFGSLASDLFDLVGEHRDLVARVERLEAALAPLVLLDAEVESDAESPAAAGASSAAGRVPPLDLLPPPIREQAVGLAARVIAEWSFPTFVDEVVRLGLGDANLDTETLPSAVYGSLVESYYGFHSRVALVEHQERMFVRELVEIATESGDYVELPASVPAEDAAAFTEMRGGVLHLQTFENPRVKRIFRFPLEEFPELAQFGELREDARDRLLLEAYELLGDRSGGR